VRNFGVSETGSCRLQYGLLSILWGGFIETVEHKFEVDSTDYVVSCAPGVNEFMLFK